MVEKEQGLQTKVIHWMCTTIIIPVTTNRALPSTRLLLNRWNEMGITTDCLCKDSGVEDKTVKHLLWLKIEGE